MTAKVLLNPYARRWEARALWPQAETALRAAGIDFSVSESDSAEHLQALARRAVLDGFAPVIIAGGDGTLGTAMNGLLPACDELKTDCPDIGILPLGTANDLVDNLGLPKDIPAAVQVIARGKTRPMDVCRVNARYFINNTALGAEAAIAWRQNQMTWAKGIWRYLAAAVIELSRMPEWEAVLDWDDGHYEGKITLLSVGNGARTGGVYYTVPDADPFDGRLTFVHGYTSSRLRLIGLMRRLMDREKPYTLEPEIHQYHTTRLHARLKTPSPAHADGEIFAQAEKEFDYQVYPGKIRIFVP